MRQIVWYGEACETLDEAQSTYIQQWFSKHRHILEKQWIDYIKKYGVKTFKN